MTNTFVHGTLADNSISVVPALISSSSTGADKGGGAQLFQKRA